MEKTISEFINKKFIEWERSTGERQTYKTFAQYLDVSYTTFSGWRNNNIPPTGENLRKVAEKLGNEIYNILGIEPPRTDRFATIVLNTIENLKPEHQTYFVTAIQKLANAIAASENPAEYEYRIREQQSDYGPIIEVKRNKNKEQP